MKEQISHWVDLLLNETLQNAPYSEKEYRREFLSHDRFLHALNDQIYNQMALRGFPKTFEGLFEEALAIESAFTAMRPSNDRQTFNIMQTTENNNPSHNSRRNRNRGRNYQNYGRQNTQSNHEAEIHSQITQSFRPYSNSYIDTSVPPPENSRGAIFQNTYFPNTGF